MDKPIQDPSKALAAAKKIRDKSGAKKAARAQGFTFLDELEQHKPKCMTKNVNTVEYDMRQFLQQCIGRYVELAGPNVKFKKVATPFPDDKIARPIMGEAEARGELQPIASRVLMKVLFAACMARFDLLRATQGLASRVTKWSPDCDKSLHRLMCYTLIVQWLVLSGAHLRVAKHGYLQIPITLWNMTIVQQADASLH